ncbi:MAG: hypothetical protein Q7W29_05020 [bacterium]|nr:hypothetical protein [bacterium]
MSVFERTIAADLHTRGAVATLGIDFPAPNALNVSVAIAGLE